MTLGSILYKTVGAVGLGTVLYDAHKWGVVKGEQYRKTQDANACLDYMNNLRYNTNQSHVTKNIKQGLFNWGISNRLRGDFNNVVGYVGGAVSNIFNSCVPLTASLVALLGKGKTSLVGAGVLAGWGALSFIRHGIGNMNSR